MSDRVVHPKGLYFHPEMEYEERTGLVITERAYSDPYIKPKKLPWYIFWDSQDAYPGPSLKDLRRTAYGPTLHHRSQSFYIGYE